MAKVYTVSKINSYIKSLLSEDFLLRDINVSGEVSNCKYHSMGHIYFTLKDSDAAISVVMFSNYKKNMDFVLKDGMKITVSGSINVFEKNGTYNILAKSIEKSGTGDLYKRFSELKKELEDMGMFSDEYKQSLPAFSSRIGVVTSSTGAAIQDIIRVSKRKNPYVEIFLYPAIVQGEKATRSIAKGIRCLDAMDLDVIIVGRGGGSIEDLWAFNEPEVANTIFNASTPIISAVGHESDYTIADFVADKRAATPSMAADMAVMDHESFTEYMQRYSSRIHQIMLDKIFTVRHKLDMTKKDLIINSPSYKLSNYKNRVNDAKARMYNAIRYGIDKNKESLRVYIERLKGLSPLDKLSLGYAFITDMEYNRINSASEVEPEEEILLNFSDGRVVSTVKRIEKAEGGNNG
jgi:exodeoxyribonuclease VII, large subunit